MSLPKYYEYDSYPGRAQKINFGGNVCGTKIDQVRFFP